MGETVGPQDFNDAGVTIYGNNQLALRVDGARYESNSDTATVQLKDAFDKREAINGNTGDVTFVYKGSTVDTDNCPDMNVSADDIERNLDVLDAIVTLNVSGIDQQEANLIEGARCFKIDQDLARDVVSLNFGQ